MMTQYLNARIRSSVANSPAITPTHIENRSIRGIQTRLFKPAVTPKSVEPLGAVYTKRWVVELLLDLAGYSSDRDLGKLTAVEPAAGDGAFLAPMIERLIHSCQIHKRLLDDCEEAITAFEINEESAHRARQLVVRMLNHAGLETAKATALAATWVQVGDFLLDAPLIEADFVIGNPPYVRLESISAETAQLYRSAYRTMCGRADLYVAFFEAALRQLKTGGVCAFICADRWMRNQYGAELRRFITSECNVKFVVEMHNANAFDDEVDAYPAITVITRSKQQPAVIAKATIDAEGLAPHEFSRALWSTARRESAALPDGISAAVVDKWFTGKDPWPCNSPLQLRLLRSLEEKFAPLESANKRTRVGIGVATGSDELFITQDSKLVEPSRLTKLALAKDISSGTVRWSGHYLVDPWEQNGLVDLDHFPRLRGYLEKHATYIKERNVAKKNPISWYRTIDRVNHSLVHTPKLYIADIKDRLIPVLDRGETYPHHNLYFVQSEEWDLEVLGGLLMSKVSQFFVESYGVRMRGGYFRFQAQYLRRIRVPAPESLSAAHSEQLILAFREGDEALATCVALDLYGVDSGELENALGH